MKKLNIFLNESLYQNLKNVIHKVLFDQIPKIDFINQVKKYIKNEYPGYHIELSKVSEIRKMKNCVTLEFMKKFYDTGNFDNASTFILYKNEATENDICADICGILIRNTYPYINKETWDPDLHQREYFIACVKTAIEYMNTGKTKYNITLKSGGDWSMNWVKL